MKKKRTKSAKKTKLPGLDFFQNTKFFGPFTFMAAAIVFGFLGQYFLYTMRQITPGLIFFAVGIALFVIADIRSRKKEPEQGLELKWEMIALGAIILLGIFFRVFMLDKLPTGCFRDEGQNGNEAINIIKGVVLDGTNLPVYIERSTQNVAMYMYFVALSFKLFGIGVQQVRNVSIVFGILSIPAFYFLIRKIFGPRMAIIGAFLIAVFRWDVNFSRIGFLGIFTAMQVPIILYFVYRAYKERKWSDFLLAGFTMSLSLYSYIAARMIPFAVILFAILILFKDFNFYKKNIKKIGAFVLVAFVTALPLLSYVAKHPQNFMARSSTVFLFNHDQARDASERISNIMKSPGPKNMADLKENFGVLAKTLIENIKKTMLMFNYMGDSNPRHNLPNEPMIDFTLGIFAFLGFGFMLCRLFNPLYFLTMSMFFMFLQSGFFSIEAPQAYRTIPNIAIVLIFAMIAIYKAYGYFREQFGDSQQQILLTLLVAALLYSGWDNYRLYFDKQANDPGCWSEFSIEEWSMGKYLHDKGDDWIGIVIPAWVNSYTFNFMTYPYKNFVNFEISEWVPIKNYIKGKNYVYILDRTYVPMVPSLQKMYPHGKYNEFRHKYNGMIMYFTYEVPKEDIENFSNRKVVTGLRGYYYKGNDWSGEVIIDRVDPFVLFNWTVDPILGPFSVKWLGRIKIDKAGQYSFSTSSNDFSDVEIDGKTVYTNIGTRKEPVKNPGNGKVFLTAGYHNIQVRYYESINYSRMELHWGTPDQGGVEEVVPSDVLFPAK